MRAGRLCTGVLAAVVYLACASSALATGNPEVNPPTSVAYFGAGVCFENLPASGISEACQNDAIEHLNTQRESIGQGKYTLPKDFDSLSAEKQMFILSDSDRVSYGEEPYIGLSPYLNQASQTGVKNDADPNTPEDLPEGVKWSNWSANWAGAFPNAELAYYAWMYDDGPGGSNLDCQKEGDEGCWGHRQGVLAFNKKAGADIMGDAAGLDSKNEQGYTQAFLLAENSSWTTFTYTWTEAMADINGPAKPAVTKISPTSGPTSGGTTVTITGTGFTGATEVWFGAVKSKSFKVESETEIKAVSPPEAAASHYVSVVTSGGTSATSAAEVYTYQAPAPTVSKISPTSGPPTGGTTVTITGTNFAAVKTVGFGGVAATSFKVVSETEITAVAPAQPEGAHHVYVSTASGTSTLGEADVYTYRAPAPTVTSISPTSGPTTGGNTVTLTGTGFKGVKTVAFGGVAATSYKVVSETEITAVAPAQAEGAHYVYVTAVGGTSALVPADVYTYKPPAPTVTNISPTSGPTAGGNTITITGTGFKGVKTVAFGSVAATSFKVVSETEITAVAPAQAAGAHYVYVTAAGGTSALIAADIYTYKS